VNVDVPRGWEGWQQNPDSVGALREILALDPKLRVLIAHGYADMSCPYFASRLIADQIPPMGPAPRLSLRLYPGGHMFYSQPESIEMLRRDVAILYAERK
jgi:carboxypeptidase C (cathepsin A)